MRKIRGVSGVTASATAPPMWGVHLGFEAERLGLATQGTWGGCAWDRMPTAWVWHLKDRSGADREARKEVLEIRGRRRKPL